MENPSYEEIQSVYDQIEADEKEINEYNTNLLKSIGASWEDLELLLDCGTLNGKIEIVTKPTGHDQEYEDCEYFFKDVWVDQHSTGYEGDSFAGFIYGKIEEGKWLKVPYYC